MILWLLRRGSLSLPFFIGQGLFQRKLLRISLEVWLLLRRLTLLRVHLFLLLRLRHGCRGG